jgi:hypothetical protein
MVTDNIAARIKAVKEDAVTSELSKEYAERMRKPEAGRITR